MKKIDADGAVGNEFTNGDPDTGVEATQVDDTWLNSLQREMIALLTATGQVSSQDNSDTTQVLKAVQILIGQGGGPNFIATFALANNQSSAQNVTDLLFDKAVYYAARMNYHIYRKDATPTEHVASGKLALRYFPVADTWAISDEREDDGDDCGIEFYVTAGGQVQYKSSNMAGGTYVGELRISNVQKVLK